MNVPIYPNSISEEPTSSGESHRQRFNPSPPPTITNDTFFNNGEEISIIQHHPLGKSTAFQVVRDTAVFLEPIDLFQIWCVGVTSGEVDLTRRERGKKKRKQCRKRKQQRKTPFIKFN